MFDPSFFTDNHRPGASPTGAMFHGRVRPDLREAAIAEWQALAIEPGYVWRSIGPNEGVAWRDGQRVAGLTCDIEIEPSQTDHLYIATRSSGVWHSANDGGTWTPRGDGLPTLQTVTVALTERAGHEPVLLTAAGELVEEERRNAGLLGAFRSVDGGASWATLDGGVGATIFRGHDANRVVSLTAEHLLVATRVGLFFSADSGRNFGTAPDHDDGRPVLRGDVTDLAVVGSTVYAVVSGESPTAVDPRPPDVVWQTQSAASPPGLYAGTYAAGSVMALSRIYDPDVAVSGAPPGGLTRLVHKSGIFMMSVAELGVPIATIQDLQNLFTNRPHHSIQVNSGSPGTAGDWSALPTSNVGPALTKYAHTLALEEPTNSGQRVRGMFGTMDMFSFRVRHGASGWAWMSGSIDNRTGGAHPDQHATVIVDRPANTPRTWVGNDGGVFVTTNRGANWTAKNSHGSMLVWTLALARKSATEAWVSLGFQDNGTAIGFGPFAPTTPTAWDWTWVNDGDGGTTAFLPAAPATNPQNGPTAALTSANGALHRSGQTSAGAYAPSETGDAPGWASVNAGDTFPFSEVVVIARGTGSPAVYDRIYFSRASSRSAPSTIFVQDAGGVPAIVPTSVAGAGARPAMVTALTAAPGDAATESTTPAAWDDLWFGLRTGELFLSRDGGGSVTSITVTGAKPRLPITGIAVDPRNSDRVVVVYGGFSESGRRGRSQKVFLTENRGASWRDISGTAHAGDHVPDIPVLGVVATRSDPLAIIIATDLGVMITKNLGATWRRLGPGLVKLPCSAIDVLNDEATAAVRSLETDGLPPIAVGTFGRGAFMLERPSAAELVIELDGGFGAMKTGEQRERTIRVHNVGNTAASIGALGATGIFTHHAGPDDPTVASFAIPARGSRAWRVRCSPTAAGIFEATLAIGSATAAVSCEAFADGKPRLAISRRRVRFGPVADTTTESERVTLTNVGQGPLTIQNIQPVVGGSAELTVVGDGFEANPSSGSAKSLAPGESADVEIRCAASGAGSTHETTFLIASDDPIAADAHHEIHAHAEVGPAPPGTGSTDEGIPDWGWALIGIGIVVVVGGIATLVVLDATDEI